MLILSVWGSFLDKRINNKIRSLKTHMRLGTKSGHPGRVLNRRVVLAITAVRVVVVVIVGVGRWVVV